jgi:pimeloyl-ACP methyl ester carboxylesterase
VIIQLTRARRPVNGVSVVDDRRSCQAWAVRPQQRRIRSFVDNGAGWHLALDRHGPADVTRRDRPPVLVVPGYGMNSFAFSHHPTGRSLVDALVDAGLEVFTIDLRRQGGAVPLASPGAPPRAETIDALALEDLAAAVDAVRARTTSAAPGVSLVGASLGGTLALAYAAHTRERHVAHLVTIGSPVRWVKVHPLVRAAFVSSRVVARVPMRGTRRLAENLLPPLARFAPWALGLYMNPTETDTSRPAELARTVEDPSPALNRELAAWIKRRDLVVGGVELSRAVASLERPYLCVAANADGIVPVDTATWALSVIGSRQKHLVIAGDASTRFAHAELFIGRSADLRVFQPLARFLESDGHTID